MRQRRDRQPDARQQDSAQTIREAFRERFRNYAIEAERQVRTVPFEGTPRQNRGRSVADKFSQILRVKFGIPVSHAVDCVSFGIMGLMTRIGLLAAGLAVAALASAQDDKLGFRFNFGYYIGQSFRLRNGGNGALNGPAISLDVQIAKSHGVEWALTPGIVLGGKLMHGSDTDGNIYSFLLTARQNFSRDGFYMKAGAGFGFTQSRANANAFRDSHDFMGTLTLGTKLGAGPKQMKKLDPTLELTGYLSRQRQLSGLSFGLSIGF